MGRDYHNGQLELQEQFDSTRLAGLLADITTDEISDELARFIEARDMFFLATADEHGRPESSYKGGEPGFVRVVDQHTIVFPVYDGNGMFLSTGNIAVNPYVGLLFVNFTDGTRLRLNGTATIETDDNALALFPGTKMVIRVRAEQVFVNCRRYVHHYELVERSTFVPSETHEPPVPDWKMGPWMEGLLPEGDPATNPDAKVEGATPQF